MDQDTRNLNELLLIKGCYWFVLNHLFIFCLYLRSGSPDRSGDQRNHVIRWFCTFKDCRYTSGRVRNQHEHVHAHVHEHELGRTCTSVQSAGG